jgi:hypothetical protein
MSYQPLTESCPDCDVWKCEKHSDAAVSSSISWDVQAIEGQLARVAAIGRQVWEAEIADQVASVNALPVSQAIRDQLLAQNAYVARCVRVNLDRPSA